MKIIERKTNVDKFNPKVNDYLIRTVSYKKEDELTVSDIEQVQLYAYNLNKALRFSKSETLQSKRTELKDELTKTIEWLFKYNINLTHLLTNI